MTTEGLGPSKQPGSHLLTLALDRQGRGKVELRRLAVPSCAF